MTVQIHSDRSVKVNVSCNFVKMEKTELKAIKEYFHLKGLTKKDLK